VNDQGRENISGHLGIRHGSGPRQFQFFATVVLEILNF
jgi:hypothetical protein